ncbi:MAG: DUF3047 domain-containing protein [Rhodospirillales bacterium]
MKPRHTRVGSGLTTVVGAIVVGLSASVASSSGQGLPAALVEGGWKEITFDGKMPNRYRACGDACIAVETQSSVSMIGRPVTVDLGRERWLNWEWRIEAWPVDTDLSRKGGDDRAIAVYVGFKYDPDSATLAETLLRPFVELSQGADAPGRGISYVWAGGETPESLMRNPYQEATSAIIVTRTADDPIGEWIMESRDVIADYARAFDAEPTGVTHVLISADSDDTGADNAASVRNITFDDG